MSFFNLEEFAPGLREAAKDQQLDLDKFLIAAIPLRKSQPGRPNIPVAGERNSVSFIKGETAWVWRAETMQSLFRGDKVPPKMGDYPPEEYQYCFSLLDLHIVDFSDCIGDLRDAELLEIFSNLRRRPDGRSLGAAHDHLWRAAAIMTAIRPLSEAEYTAIMERMERSCRTFRQGSTSRNLVAMLRSQYE
jgi:hypothetical protein